jgi:hypothetical protein
MKVNDYLVTFEELSTMGFPVKAGTTPPINNKCVTKGEVNTYYTVDTTVSPFSTYTDDRCPRYQDLVGISCVPFVPVITQTTVAQSDGQVITPDCVDEFVYKFQISAGAGIQQPGGVVRLQNYLPAGIQAVSFRYVYYDGKAIGPGINDWPLPTSDYYEVVTFTSDHVDIALKKPIGNGHTYTVAFNAKVTGGGNTYTNTATLSGLSCDGLIQQDTSNTFTISPTNVAIAISTDLPAQSHCGTVKRYKVDVTNSGCKIIGGTLSVVLPSGLYIDTFEAILYDDKRIGPGPNEWPLPTSDYYTLDVYEQTPWPPQHANQSQISVTLKKAIGAGFNYSLYFYAYTTSTTTQDYTITASYTNFTHIRSQSNTSSYTGYPTTSYYELSGCNPADYAYTTIVPYGVNNRYILPSTGATYTYTGATTTQCTVPPQYNASIQRTEIYYCCDSTPNWQNNGSYSCYGTCDNYYVQTDLNNCPSNPTAGQTRQGSVYQYNSTACGGCCGQSSVQTQGAQVGTYHTCSGGIVSQSPVYSNSNTCYGGPYVYLLNGTWLSYNPSNAYPSTTSNCQDTGSAYCQGSNWVINQTQANPCSSAGCGVRVIEYNSVTHGCYDPCAGNTAPIFTYQNYTSCYNCYDAPVYKDTNTCSSTNGQYYVENQAGNKVYVGGQPTGVSCNYTSNCQDTGSAYCSGPNWVINQAQQNPCSSASCGVRVIEYNSVSNGCYTPPANCTTWTLYNNNGFGLTDYVEWTNCDGSAGSDAISDGSFLVICFLNGTSVGYSYSTPEDNGPC